MDSEFHVPVWNAFLQLSEHSFRQDDSDLGKCTFVAVRRGPDSPRGELVRILTADGLLAASTEEGRVERLEEREGRGDP